MLLTKRITNQHSWLFRMYLFAMLVSLTNWAVLGIFMTPDTHGYTDPARGFIEQGIYGQVSTTGDYVPSAYRTPGTSLLFMPFYAISHSETFMFFSGTLIFSLLAPLLPIFAFEVGRQYSLVAGVIGYFLMLMHANLHFNAVSVMSDLPFAAFFALANILILKLVASERPSSNLAILTGAVIALCTLIRPTGLYWCLGLIVLLMLQKRKRWISHLKQSALILITVSCFIIPWVIRNGIAMNSFSMETIKGIALLWSIGDKIENYPDDSKHIHATKSVITAFPNSRFMQYYYNGYDYTLHNEANVSHTLSQIATQYIVKNPREFAFIWRTNFTNIFVTQIHYDAWLDLLRISPTYKKVRNFAIGQVPRLDTKIYHVSLELKRISSILIYLILPGLAILLIRSPFVGALSCWSMLSIAGLTAFVSGYDRFRLPLDPIICALAGICASKILNLIKKGISFTKESWKGTLRTS